MGSGQRQEEYRLALRNTFLALLIDSMQLRLRYLPILQTGIHVAANLHLSVLARSEETTIGNAACRVVMGHGSLPCRKICT